MCLIPRSLLYFFSLQGGILTHLVLIPLRIHADLLAIDISDKYMSVVWTFFHHHMTSCRPNTNKNPTFPGKLIAVCHGTIVGV